MLLVTIFLSVFALLVISLVIKAKQAGPRQVAETELERARTLVRISADNPGSGWEKLGSKTTADGINLRFDHDDDPQAEASLMVPERDRGKGVSNFGHVLSEELTDSFATHHIHTAGYVFRIRLRGDSTVAGKTVGIQMKVTGANAPLCGQIENDDDTDAAVGGWIEVAWAEVLEL